MQEMSYNFENKVKQLPLKFNLGDASFPKEQQDQLHDIIYDSQWKVFLNNEYLGFCDKLTYTIPTIPGKAEYLHYNSIMWQLQGEVGKCSDMLLNQGIIMLSRSSYTLLVVIVCKKSGEIWFCVNYQKLNPIVVRKAFPLPQIDETLDKIHKCQWFSSFTPALGCV